MTAPSIMKEDLGVLNPVLYNKLLIAFPQGVKICNPGQPMVYDYLFNDSRIKMNISYWGESYKVCCFNCGDTRFRLYISHKYGEPDEFTQKPNYNLFICFNEQCQKLPEVREELYRRIYLSNFDSDLFLENTAQGTSEANQTLFFPEEIINIKENLGFVIKNYPEIYAYLLNKCGTVDNVRKVCDKYFLGVILKSSKKYLEHGLFIPVIYEGDAVGWQVRTFIPKKHFWSSPKIKNFLYFCADALYYSTIILCEGPGDVWALGDEGVALFGKSISLQQIKIIKEKFINCQNIIVALDGDAIQDAHRIAENLARELDNKSIYVLELPNELDPADMGREGVLKWLGEKKATKLYRKK